MSSPNTSQTGPGPDDGNINASSASQHPGAVVHAIDHYQSHPQGSNDVQPQNNEHANTGTHSLQLHPSAQSSGPIVLRELAMHPPRWPAGGFSYHDPAAAHMVSIMQSLDARPPTLSAVRDIIFLPNTDPNKRRSCAFEQLLRRQTTDGGNHNFFVPFPHGGRFLTGKVNFSETGVAIITEALRAVVRAEVETVLVAPLSQQVDRLNAANGAMSITTPGIVVHGDRYFDTVCPFTPEGVRMVVALLQAALGNPGSKYAIFYANAEVDPPLARGRLASVLINPIVGWTN